jgi:hypothetical protein
MANVKVNCFFFYTLLETSPNKFALIDAIIEVKENGFEG